MGLFSKKYCDVCGKKIGLLGNRKLEDGNLCKDCAAKLSPWFSERKQSTVEEIKEQLTYREANKEAVAAFHITKAMGENTKFYFDEDNGKFMVTWASDINAANPDVLSFTDVTGCDVDIREGKDEIRYKDEQGNTQSFNPKRYAFRYDFYLRIYVNHPWFREMVVRLNSSAVDGDVKTLLENHEAAAIGKNPMTGSNRPMGTSGAAGAGRPVAVSPQPRPLPGTRPQVQGPMGNRPKGERPMGYAPNQSVYEPIYEAYYDYDPTSNADEIKSSTEYIEYETMAYEIKDIMLQARREG